MKELVKTYDIVGNVSEKTYREMTRKEVVERLEKRAKELIGVKYHVNPLNSFPGYKNRSKKNLMELLKGMDL
ncbi:hypothetical protein [Candidatus Oleimmundimicrobium sp.]|uniref:hypothetical protein n=1 Tax=Candidatus Oleimmundimicrobium sp. TaxID=3060597 RepID=UPI0027264B28|nr:hypothetical protein [Candidatus Oleimmundimicrobium sp.]MDO8885737.1 hypothetical protein [Candidatus Oleimmundimicrobium sp.]